MPGVPRLDAPAAVLRPVPGFTLEGDTRGSINVTRLGGCGFAPRNPQSSRGRALAGYETYFSASVSYSKMSLAPNHTSISRLASAALADACTRLATGSPLALA